MNNRSQKIAIVFILLIPLSFIVIKGFTKQKLYLEEGKNLVISTDCQEESSIDIWYGDVQRSGKQGRPQRWVNVLGNVCNSEQVKNLEYQLNQGSPKQLTIGSDLHRLAKDGDFNVELAWKALNVGKNELKIIKTNQTGEINTVKVTLNIEEEKKWDLPYSVDFTQLEDLEDLLEKVQVVDGLWELTSQGLRTKEPYYDRVVTMGDTTWENYEAIARLTIHDFTPSSPGPPTYNVTHFGMAFRWRGHTVDGLQPSRQWYPLGAQGEFLLMEDKTSAQWRILFSGGEGAPRPVYSNMTNYQLGKELYVRGQVRTMEDGRTRYRYKQWMVGTQEPSDWIVEGFEDDDEYPSGALCLVPHNSDVTLHEVKIEPL